MGKRVVLGCVVMVSGILFAQQPVPVGKTDTSAKNYRSLDGSPLSKHSSDDELARALNENYGNNPEFGGVQVTVKHRKVTLSGTVVTNSAKDRARDVAEHTVGVRSVRNHIKLGDVDTDKRAVVMTSAH
jgi:osmotically-inducible protein OsmY